MHAPGYVNMALGGGYKAILEIGDLYEFFARIRYLTASDQLAWRVRDRRSGTPGISLAGFSG
jgi:hypothetical protein